MIQLVARLDLRRGSVHVLVTFGSIEVLSRHQRLSTCMHRQYRREVITAATGTWDWDGTGRHLGSCGCNRRLTMSRGCTKSASTHPASPPAAKSDMVYLHKLVEHNLQSGNVLSRMLKLPDFGRLFGSFSVCLIVSCASESKAGFFPVRNGHPRGRVVRKVVVWRCDMEHFVVGSRLHKVLGAVPFLQAWSCT